MAAARSDGRRARKARRALWWERLKAERARQRDKAAWLRARVRWAKGVLRREAAEGGAACVYSVEQHRSWPPERPLSPGVAMRDAEESERAVVALAARRESLKRERAAVEAQVDAVQLGVHGGPGASAGPAF